MRFVRIFQLTHLATPSRKLTRQRLGYLATPLSALPFTSTQTRGDPPCLLDPHGSFTGAVGRRYHAAILSVSAGHDPGISDQGAGLASYLEEGGKISSRHQIKASRDKASKIRVGSRLQHQNEIEAAKACRYAVLVGQKNTVRGDIVRLTSEPGVGGPQTDRLLSWIGEQHRPIRAVFYEQQCGQVIVGTQSVRQPPATRPGVPIPRRFFLRHIS